jgi:hypothetical protein
MVSGFLRRRREKLEETGTEEGGEGKLASDFSMRD